MVDDRHVSMVVLGMVFVVAFTGGFLLWSDGVTGAPGVQVGPRGGGGVATFARQGQQFGGMPGQQGGFGGGAGAGPGGFGVPPGGPLPGGGKPTPWLDPRRAGAGQGGGPSGCACPRRPGCPPVVNCGQPPKCRPCRQLNPRAPLSCYVC